MANKKKRLSKLQIARRATQLAFTGLLIAGLYYDIRIVIMLFIPATLVFGNFFCGWVCPYGSMQELMRNIGSLFIKKQYKMPRHIQKFMQYTRYILFVILTVGIADVILTPLNGYSTYLGLFMDSAETALSTTALVIMGAYLLISMFFERPFCNYLCTEAAKYGVLNQTRIFSIKRNENTCVNCKQCNKACPMNIEVSVHEQVRNGQCINCMKCIEACPVPGTLTYTRVEIPFLNRKKKEA